MTVGQMLRSMTAREYDAWRQFAALEPFGDRRGDVQAATVAQTVAAAMSGKSMALDDFLPDYDKEPEEILTDGDGNPLRKLDPQEEAETIAAFQAQAARSAAG